MMKFKRVFLLLLLSFLLISSSVLATDTANTDQLLVSTQETDTVTEVPKSTVQTLNEDCYISKTDSYTLESIVNGNVFATATKFVTNPRTGGGEINGDLYLICTDAIIGSDVTYSDKTDITGNYIISTINSKTKINGNVFVIADTFTLEAGAEINGDLYVAAKKVDIQQDSYIKGNAYITAEDVTFNGQVASSLYVATNTFKMNYFAYISKDLHLSADDSTLSGITYRNAFVTSRKLNTLKGFRIYGDLNIEYAKEFTLTGEINGNATINAESLNIQNNTTSVCKINGNLKYGVKNDCQIPDNVVQGEVSSVKYVNRDPNKLKVYNAIVALFTLLFYVIVVIFLAKKLAPGMFERFANLTVKNCSIALGVGFLSFFVVAIVFVLLLVTSVGLYVAFALGLGYLFIIAIAVPFFVYKVSELLNLKWNEYLKVILLTTILYLVGLIPYVGPFISLVVFTSSIGYLLVSLFKKVK